MRTRGCGRKRIGFGVLTAAIALGAGGPAAADEGRSLVVVGEGAEGDAVADRIVSHVEGYAVRDANPFRGVMLARGVRSFGPAVGNPTRDAQLVAAVHAAAVETYADVAILISVRKAKRGSLAHVWIIDARGTGTRVDKDIPLGSSAHAREEADAAWASLAATLPAAAPARELAKTTPPPPAASPGVAASAAPSPAPAPANDTETDAPSAADHDTGVSASPRATKHEQPRANTLFLVQAAMGVGSRRFTYVDRVTPQLRPYDLFAAPMPSISAEVYPFSSSRLPVVNGLGLTGDYARAIGIGSTDEGGTSVGTSWQSYDIGLRERYAPTRALLLGADVGFGGVDFHFDADPSSTALLPGIHYRFVRAGLDARVAFGGLSVYAGGGYLGVTSTGGMGAFFSHESVGGVDAKIGVAYMVARHFEASLELDYTRFFFSFNPVPGDPGVAGGALDEMGRLSLAVAYLN